MVYCGETTFLVQDRPLCQSSINLWLIRVGSLFVKGKKTLMVSWTTRHF